MASFERISFSDGFDTGGLMATITITLNGSALPGLAGNPSKVYTLSDADLQVLLTWAASAFASDLPGNPTNPQVLLAWLQGQLVTPTIGRIRQFNSTQTTPPPITVS